MSEIDAHVRLLKLEEAVDLFGNGCHTSTLEAVLREPEWATERARILAEEYRALKEKTQGMFDTGKSRDYWVLEAGRYSDELDVAKRRIIELQSMDTKDAQENASLRALLTEALALIAVKDEALARLHDHATDICGGVACAALAAKMKSEGK